LTFEPWQLIAALVAVLTAILGVIRFAWDAHRAIVKDLVDRCVGPLAEMTKDRDFWRALALKGRDVAEQAIAIAEKADGR
jgi:hypothetical protein